MGGRQPVAVKYPYGVQVSSDGLLKGHPITSSLDSVSFQWASPITFNETETIGKRVSVIAKSSEKSWIDTDLMDVGPDPTGISAEAPLNVEAESKIIAVVLEGKFDSYFEGELMPFTEDEQAIISAARERERETAADGVSAADESTDDAADDAPEEDPRVAAILERKVIPQSPPTRIMVISDADFIRDGGQNPLGSIFAIRAIEWFTVGSDLISIQARGVVDRSLDVLEDRERAWIKALNITGVPLLVCLLGVVRFLFRRRQRRGFAALQGKGMSA